MPWASGRHDPSYTLCASHTSHMKHFDQLTRLGRIRRQRGLALAALEGYDFEVAQLNFLADHTNTLFKVVTTSGEKYALRIYSDGETTIKENRAEIFWLNRLKRDTDLNITEPIQRKDGSFVAQITLPGLPPDQRVVLLSWIPGKPLADALSPKYYLGLGEALAKLHQHSFTLRPLPDEINPKRLDKVFYYPNEPIVYKDPNYADLFSAERIDIMERVVARGRALFEQLFSDPTEQILIHGDLHYWNVHLYQNRLYLIDFEDLNLGYPIQDIAIVLYYGRDREDAVPLQNALAEGYAKVRPWPLQTAADFEAVDTIIAARMAMFANYVAHTLPPEEGKGYLDGWFAELQKYLDNLPLFKR